jgi:hypothetical protein
LAQLILDPRSVFDADVRTPLGPIPKTVRAFGYVPNIHDWKPGDLILVSDLSPGFVSRRIISRQSEGGYSTVHAQWHHAAVHLGKGTICEADRHGVHCSTIYSYVGDHLIRLRRDPNITIETGFEICQYALMSLTAPYSFWEIIRLFFKSREGFWNQGSGPRIPGVRATICSRLYAEAYMSATGRVMRGASGETTPAYLSSAPHLTDVQTSWSKISD